MIQSIRHILNLQVVWLMAGPLWAGEWTTLGPRPLEGPFSGRLSSVAASSTDPDVYYVGAATGGVWRTLDGGGHWDPLTDHLPTTSIGALALDPFNHDVIYAGSGEANFANHSPYGLGLYKSTDGGASWEILAQETFAGRTFSKIAVSAVDTAVLYAAVSRAGGFPALNAAKGHPRALGPVGIFRSTDGGESWTQLTNGLPSEAASDVVVHALDTRTLFAAIGNIFGSPDNGVYKSTDGGESWMRLGGGLPANAGRISLAQATSDPLRLYALITRPANATGGGASTLDIFRSEDGGTTWTATTSGNFQATYGWYLSTLLIDPADADRFFAGGVTLLRSSTGGDSYTNVTPPHVDVHGLAFDAAGNLLCANDGGLHRSETDGGNWIALNDTLSTVQFYAGLSVHPDDPTIIIGGTQDNGTNLRSDDSTLWVKVLGADGGYTAIRPDQPNVIFAEFQGTANLLRSTNGGATFSQSNSGINSFDRNCFLPPFAFLPDGSGHMLYATQRIYRSIDGGANWTHISADLTAGPPAAVRALAIAPSDAGIVYAATNDGRVLVSTDGGADWTLSLSDVAGWPRVTRELCVDPIDAGRAYLAIGRFGGNQVLMTRDQGRSWAPIAGDLPDVPANTVAVHNPGFGRMVYVGTDRGVYVSCDDGREWRRFAAGMPHCPVIDILIDEHHGRIVAGTLGRGEWTYPLPQLFDADDNGHVDMLDFAALQRCFSGSRPAGGDPPPPPCLVPFDLDADDVIDLSDYACGYRALNP